MQIGIAAFCCMLAAFAILLYVPLLDSILTIMQHVHQLKEMQSFGPPPSTTFANAQLDKSPAMDYQAALMAVSCFVTPLCFHRHKCRYGVPHKIKRSKKWEEMSFCTEDLQHASKNSDASNVNAVATKDATKPCLVYSFGTFHNLEWETKVARLFNCEVHAFDPTVSQRGSKDVEFHKIGLQGEGTDMASANGAEYDAIDPRRLFTLTQIRKKLGHEDRTIDLLMMDCEGESMECLFPFS